LLLLFYEVVDFVLASMFILCEFDLFHYLCKYVIEILIKIFDSKKRTILFFYTCQFIEPLYSLNLKSNLNDKHKSRQKCLQKPKKNNQQKKSKM